MRLSVWIETLGLFMETIDGGVRYRDWGICLEGEGLCNDWDRDQATDTAIDSTRKGPLR